MRKQITMATEYKYRGEYIYKITRRDFCVYDENGMVVIDALTLKEAKAEIDKRFN